MGDVTRTPGTDGASAPEVLARVRELVQPSLEAAVERLDDPLIRLIAKYQLGWCDAEGNPTAAGGKAIRPALAVLSAEAVVGPTDAGIPGAVAVELIHNFSLLHDDVMDRDLERRHRPTGWVAFGEGQAILAGNAMLTAAVQVLLDTGLAGRRSLPCLLSATQQLINGQSQDLALERRESVTLEEMLTMEAGKTAALLSCSSMIGALAVGAPDAVVDGLAGYGYELGLAFQLVDDILGVVGDTAKTGKSSSSDIRAGKRSAPIVAALSSGTAAGDQLADLLAGGPPSTDEGVDEASRLVSESGGLEWAATEADARLKTAVAHLDGIGLVGEAVEDLTQLAHYIVARDR
jgi:geranylgeranyl diphosphate synthase type I